ncbi:MAG: hypothetical protein QME49_08785, partial [bacterium]|nr:hypothetical protein [bacterium]
KSIPLYIVKIVIVQPLFFGSEEPCGRDRRASKSKFKQPELFKVFFSNSSKYIGTAAETAGCINY